MVLYLYNNIDEYLQYRTRTSVSILNPSNMPKVEWFLCGELESLYNDSQLGRNKKGYRLENTFDYDQIIIGLFWNGTKIKDHGQPFIRETDKCWQIHGIPSLGYLTFILRTRTRIAQNFYLTRDVEGQFE